jgi:hypothetical protein
MIIHLHHVVRYASSSLLLLLSVAINSRPTSFPHLGVVYGQQDRQVLVCTVGNDKAVKTYLGHEVIAHPCRIIIIIIQWLWCNVNRKKSTVCDGVLVVVYWRLVQMILLLR